MSLGRKTSPKGTEDPISPILAATTAPEAFTNNHDEDLRSITSTSTQEPVTTAVLPENGGIREYDATKKSSHYDMPTLFQNGFFSRNPKITNMAAAIDTLAVIKGGLISELQTYIEKRNLKSITNFPIGRSLQYTKENKTSAAQFLIDLLKGDKSFEPEEIKGHMGALRDKTLGKLIRAYAKTNKNIGTIRNLVQVAQTAALQQPDAARRTMTSHPR